VSSLGTYDLSQVRPLDQRWLMDGCIPLRAITAIVGASDVGKTTMICRLAERVTNGGLVGEFWEQPQHVIMATREDDLETFLAPRLVAAKADLTKIHHPKWDDKAWRFPNDIWKLAQMIAQHDARCVLLDPLSAFIPAMSNPTVARDALEALTHVAQAQDCAIVFLIHFTKLDTKDLLRAIGGAAAIHQVPRAVHIFGRAPRSFLESIPPDADSPEPDSERRVLAPVIMNVGEKPLSLSFHLDLVKVDGVERHVPVFRIGDECDTSAEQVFSATASSADTFLAPALEDAVQFLLGELADGPRLSIDVIEAAKQQGIPGRTLERARAKLMQEGVLIRRKRQKDETDPGKWELRLKWPDAPPEE